MLVLDTLRNEGVTITEHSLKNVSEAVRQSVVCCFKQGTVPDILTHSGKFFAAFMRGIKESAWQKYRAVPAAVNTWSIRVFTGVTATGEFHANCGNAFVKLSYPECEDVYYDFFHCLESESRVQVPDGQGELVCMRIRKVFVQKHVFRTPGTLEPDEQWAYICWMEGLPRDNDFEHFLQRLTTVGGNIFIQLYAPGSYAEDAVAVYGLLQHYAYPYCPRNRMLEYSDSYIAAMEADTKRQVEEEQPGLAWADGWDAERLVSSICKQ